MKWLTSTERSRIHQLPHHHPRIIRAYPPRQENQETPERNRKPQPSLRPRYRAHPQRPLHVLDRTADEDAIPLPNRLPPLALRRRGLWLSLPLVHHHQRGL